MLILFLLLIPLIASALAAAAARGRERFIEYGALTASLLQTALVLAIGAGVLERGTVRLSALFATDALGAFVLLFIAIVGLAAALHSVGHLREEVRKGIVGFRRVRQYFVLFHLFFFAMFAAVVTTSPILMWAAVEATTLATAFLITFYNKPSALEAGWKFLIINSVGLLLGFLGTLLFLSAAAAAGAPDAFVTWSTLDSLGMMLDPTLIQVAFIFVLVGFGTKVGLVPMHTWLPDAHSKAPIPISGLLSGVLLNIALIGILRFRAIVDSAADPIFSAHLLVGFGIISLVVAAFIIYAQKNYKRLLAYSSIENMGIIAIGFGIGGLASTAALFHMFYHALLKPLLFFAAGNMFLKYGSTKIAEVCGALSLLPVSGAIFFASLLAISGVPPSGLFFTKLSILAEGMQQFPYLMILALAALTVVFAGFVRHATRMLFREAPRDLPKGEANGWTLMSVALLSTIFIVVSLWVPEPLAELVARTVETM